MSVSQKFALTTETFNYASVTNLCGKNSDRDRDCSHLTAILNLLYFTRNLARIAHMGI